MRCWPMMGKFEIWVILLSLFRFCLQDQILNSQSLTCNTNDLGALQRFLIGLKSGVDGWDMSNSTSSSASNCCNWSGITCNSGKVVSLELPQRRLIGKISESLGDLDRLRTLNLSSNFLSGSLPQSLFHLPNLEVLDISGNDLSGFDTSGNSIDSLIPMDICRNSSRIKFIDFSDNLFSGKILDGVMNCSSLQHLSFGFNYLTGDIPVNLFQLQDLTHLSFHNNRLSGKLTDDIGNLSNLVLLDVSSNMFLGAIPDVFHSLRKLEVLSLHSNNFTGQIPPLLFNSRSLVSLSLRNNSLSGPVHLTCSRMVHLTSLELSSNKFSGHVPDLSSCLRLERLSLGRNNFAGQIPKSFRNLQSLSHLSLSNCSIYNLSETLGILQNCQNLTTLVLTLSFRNEELPSDPSLKFSSLKALIIANSRLTGAIPGWMSGSTRLQLLDLSWNQLSGSIPHWISSTFEDLFYLDLSCNFLSGEIPKNLTELPSLTSRNMPQKDFSLGFPFFFGGRMSGRRLQYNHLWSFPPTLDLSNNSLEGPIWPEFGRLKLLHDLDLGLNNLRGSIPSNLSDMANIEYLDLSYNQLSGTIPAELVRLSFLSWFTVAYNQLHGTIPSGGQFLTFPNSSFVGNLGLCYEHSVSCSVSEQVPGDLRPHDDSERSDIVMIWLFVGMGIGVGFGIGFWIGWSDRLLMIAPKHFQVPNAANLYSFRVPKTSLKVIISLRYLSAIKAGIYSRG